MCFPSSCRRCASAAMIFRAWSAISRKSSQAVWAGKSRAFRPMPWMHSGIIRELENIIERAVILSPGSELYLNLGDLKTDGDGSEKPARPVSLADAERDHILGVLRNTGWV